MPALTATPIAPIIQLGEFTQVVTRLILDTDLPSDTPAPRIKQIGMMIVIHMMTENGIETNANNVCKTSGVARATLPNIMKPLLIRRLLREEMRRNRTGKGRCLLYVFDDGLYEAINAARPSIHRLRLV